MAESHTKQLEDKLARYERIMSECPHCKPALALEDVDNAMSPAVPPPSDGSSQQNAPESSSTTSTLRPRKSIPITRQGRSNRPSKRVASASQSKPSSSNIELVGPFSSIPASSSHSEEIASGLPRNKTRQSTRSSKQAPAEAIAPPLASSSEQQAPAEVIAPPLASSSGQQALTAHSLNLRPKSLKPSTRGMDNLLVGSNGQNTSGSNLGKRETPRSNPNYQARWIASADKMLGEVPLGWVWNKTLSQLDKSMLAAVTIDTTTVADDTINAVDGTQNNDHLLRLVRGYAHRHSDKRVNFQNFLLVCLCNFLSARKIPQHSIVKALQICISDTSEKNIDKYLKGAQWVNKIMDRLFLMGWRYRAIDLIAIWNCGIATYGMFAATTSTSDYFISHLTQPEYCENVQEIPNRVHDTIPWILKKELGEEASYVPPWSKDGRAYSSRYESICRALGYSNDYILETKHLHSSTPPSPDPNPHSSEDEVSTSDSRSFHTARQSTTGVPDLQQPESADSILARHFPSEIYLRTGASFLKKRMRMHEQLQGDDSPEDPAGKDPPTSQSVAFQSTKQIVADRSAKPLEDQDSARRRRIPGEDSSLMELLISTSMGESASEIQSSKRPLPESPTSAFHPINATRRRQNPMEQPNREEMGPLSQPGKKSPKNQRG